MLTKSAPKLEVVWLHQHDYVHSAFISGLTYFCKCNISLALSCRFQIWAFITMLELPCVLLYTVFVGTRDFCLLLKCATQATLQRIGMYGMYSYSSFAHKEKEEQRNKSLKCLRNHSFSALHFFHLQKLYLSNSVWWQWNQQQNCDRVRIWLRAKHGRATSNANIS